MQNIRTIAELKNSIKLIDTERDIQERLLKEQFQITYESLKPIYLLKSTIDEVTSSPFLIDKILGTTIGIATGYLSRKAFVGASGNIVRKLIGSVLQFGVTNLVAQHADSIKSFGKVILQYVSSRKETKI